MESAVAHDAVVACGENHFLARVVIADDGIIRLHRHLLSLSNFSQRQDTNRTILHLAAVSYEDVVFGNAHRKLSVCLPYLLQISGDPVRTRPS